MSELRNIFLRWICEKSKDLLTRANRLLDSEKWTPVSSSDMFGHSALELQRMMNVRRSKGEEKKLSGEYLTPTDLSCR
jgi:hypothetical protein